MIERESVREREKVREKEEKVGLMTQGVTGRIMGVLGVV